MALQVRHLLPERFPAAWNIARTDVFGDPSKTQRRFVLQSGSSDCHRQLRRLRPWVLNALFGSCIRQIRRQKHPSHKLQHGYDVSRILGANGFGANPFSTFFGCVDLRLIQAFQSGRLPNQPTDDSVNNLPAPSTKFIVNVSRDIEVAHW